MIRRAPYLLLILVSCLFFVSTIQAADIVGLGDLPGGLFYSEALGVSADGNVVVGYSSSANGNEAFRWTQSDGMAGLGNLTGGISYSYPNGISADGSVVVGESRSNNGDEAFRWTQSSGMVGLGDLPGGGFESYADGVSDDGSVVVGLGTSASGAEAFRWTQVGGMVGLGDLAGGSFFSHAYGVSSDGSVVVGSGSSANGDEAFRWTQAGGMVGLGDLPEGGFNSEAYKTSSDGSIVVGYGTSANGAEAFRWTQAGGIVGLGDLAGGSFGSVAIGISSDGSVVVGRGSSANGDEAFRWTQSSGMESIQEILSADGIDMSGWQLESANGVSADGNIIVGDGTSPNGTEAWLVRLGSGLLTADAVASSIATLLPATESGHALAREGLETHLNIGRHYRGRPGASFDLYAAGFGGEWNSYTTGGTIGLVWNYSDSTRFGAGVFKSSYNENNLDFSGKYELDSLGGTLWVGYADPSGGLQVNAVGLLASLDNTFERGYLNGSGIDHSTGDSDGNMKGLLLRLGWQLPVGENKSLTPFASYTWSEVEIDGYTETGGGFPAQFDSRKDDADIIKVGVEGELQISESIGLWGQTAYGKRLDKNSTGISGEIIGLMDFSQPGYKLDDKWIEADLGIKWQASKNVSLILTGGSAFGNDQNPDWRTSLGISWALM